jgi:hypothetical protein
MEEGFIVAIRQVASLREHGEVRMAVFSGFCWHEVENDGVGAAMFAF